MLEYHKETELERTGNRIVLFPARQNCRITSNRRLLAKHQSKCSKDLEKGRRIPLNQSISKKTRNQYASKKDWKNRIHPYISSAQKWKPERIQDGR
jgi:hypothetical protein